MLGFGSLGEFALGEFSFQPPTAAFSDFSVTARMRSGLAVAIVATTFGGFVAPPRALASPEFSQFSQPLALRATIADEQSSALFEITLPVIIKQQDGGGDDRHLHDRRKKRTGFEPIKKAAPFAYVEPFTLPLPPFKERAPVKVDLPAGVDRSLIPPDLLGLQDEIRTAQDVFDIQQFLRGVDQDEQDAADIADVLAILDLEESEA